ncbi:hypothetical protein B0J11DRAFT_429154 [Dendryphion nanum]|uniref:Uncharacterized protein n=1 Tax=Dendryphion nanum TaxID=256645 RepID=A0A9P9E3Q3_9PLEO|nr:hypothetical protein B0J11DRAFT_429154 [Dendryphion nanum]
MFLLTTLLASGVTATILAKPGCITDTRHAGLYTNGTIRMNENPLRPFDYPMTDGFNLTTGEEWSFEGVSADGKSGIAYMLSRGTIAGNLLAQRTFIAITWPNGTRYMESRFADVSTIEMCKTSTIGTWSNETSGLKWSFESSNDYSHTVVKIDSANIKGTIKLDSLSPAVYPNGLTYPDRRGNALFAPYIYWAETVPVATTEVDLVVKGTPYTIKGIGGRERNWNSFSWVEVSLTWNMIRATAGPYTLMAWIYTSKVDGQTYFTSVIMEGKEVVFRTQNLEASKNSTSGSFNLAYGGAVHLTSDPSAKPLPPSKHTGYVLEMLDPKAKKHWKFEIDYTQTVYLFPSSNITRVGGFVGALKGGLVGGRQYLGRASGNVQDKI